MKGRQLAGKYQPVEVEGAAIGLVAEQYQASRQAFWQTLMSATTWQQTRKVIALNHRGCAAMKIAYGLAKASDKLIETETHRYALREFRHRMAERNADLEVEIGLIEPDGKVAIFK
jgi:carbonic anhydrase